jgi:hypothetical protein
MGKEFDKLYWQNLDWKSAQDQVISLLHQRGYMSLYETTVLNGRIDGLVIRKSINEVDIGIVEVKHYRNVTKSMLLESIQQGLKYLEGNYLSFLKRFAGRNKTPRFFVAIVFTKDCPITNINEQITNSIDLLPDKLRSYPIELFYSSILDFLTKMRTKGLINGDQNVLTNFFD